MQDSSGIVFHALVVCGLLQHITAEITALVNDTVGTLASAQYGDLRNNTDTCISIIVGTGWCRPLQEFHHLELCPSATVFPAGCASNLLSTAQS